MCKLSFSLLMGHSITDQRVLLTLSSGEGFLVEETPQRGGPWAWINAVMEMHHCFRDRSLLRLFRFSKLQKACTSVLNESVERVLAATPRSTMDVGDVTGRSALSWAAQRGDRRTIRTLISYGADPNKADVERGTPFIWSVIGGHVHIIKLLLAIGANVDAKGDFGRISLSLSAQQDSCLNITKLLVNYGADVETQDKGGFTPLHWAVSGNAVKNLTYFLDNGAKANVPGVLGFTALHLAIIHNKHEALKVLIKLPIAGPGTRSGPGRKLPFLAA